MTAITAETPKRPLLARFLEATVLWVPHDRTPRFLAFGLILVRQTTLPFILLTALLAPFSTVLPAHQVLALTIGLGSFVVFEELGRWSFVRRADKPGQALATFTAMIIAVETCLYYRADKALLWNLTTRAPSWIIHILAGVALYFGIKRRPAAIGWIIGGLIVIHTLFNVISAQATLPAGGPEAAIWSFRTLNLQEVLV